MYFSSLMLLGSGELGREFAIAAKRLGCRVIACDRYPNAPAMQLSDAFEVFSMLDGAALR
nr:phosphoribosylglycinamide formyltransferase 2 [Sphingomonas sp.]